MISFFINCLSFFKDLIKILINYSCILLCSCIKNKCIDNNEEINENIKSPTPLLKKSKHPILDAYENKIIEKINNNN